MLDTTLCSVVTTVSDSVLNRRVTFFVVWNHVRVPLAPKIFLDLDMSMTGIWMDPLKSITIAGSPFSLFIWKISNNDILVSNLLMSALTDNLSVYTQIEKILLISHHSIIVIIHRFIYWDPRNWEDRTLGNSFYLFGIGDSTKSKKASVLRTTQRDLLSANKSARVVSLGTLPW